MTTHWTLPRAAALASVFLAMTVLSGCLENNANSASAPKAVLEVDHPTAQAGDEVTFDGQSSTAGNGTIRSWRFDFGDGQSTEATSQDAARVKHTYTQGGLFEAHLTVTVERKSGDVQEATDSASLTMDERVPVQELLLSAGMAADANVSVPARTGARTVEFDLAVNNTAVLGQSVLELQLVGSDGKMLLDKNITVPQTGSVQVTDNVNQTSSGDDALHLQVTQGSVRVTGDLLVHYTR